MTTIETAQLTDPAAFVAAAERATNDRDLAAVMGVYSPDAVLEAITDGTLEVHRGAEAIRAAWTAYLEVLAKGDFRLRKTFLAAGEEWITNRWEGTLAGQDARGLESWRFDAEGRVDRHLLYSFLNVKPSQEASVRLRMLVSYPRTALRFLRATNASHHTGPATPEQERFAEQFATGWAMGSRDAFLDYFRPLIAPDVRLEAPPMPTQTGWEGFVSFVDGVFGLMPDLRGEVRGWEPTATGVRVSLDLVGTLAGKPVRLHTDDEITLRDGQVAKRVAHLDQVALLRATLRPRALPLVARAWLQQARG